MSITHEVSLNLINSSHVHVGVIATLHNSSKVRVRIRNAKSVVHQVSPVENDEIYGLWSSSNDNIIFWPAIDTRHRSWCCKRGSGKGELIIEPGQSYSIEFNHKFSNHVTSFLLQSHFHNCRFLKGSEHHIGWFGKSFHKNESAAGVGSASLQIPSAPVFPRRHQADRGQQGFKPDES